ncbi:MAG TPA: polysaccharide biosynthesis/export family protein [Chitinivibrionales bacterium]
MKKIIVSLLVLTIASLSPAAIIKAGDVLEIVVQAHPEFSGRFTVAENGAVDYPLLADQVIVNITTSELMNDLTLRLAKHIDNPLVVISVVEKPEIAVFVLGQVKNPGPVKTYMGATLQEALQLSGGPLPTADLQNVKIVRKNGSNENAETYDLKAFMLTGNLDNMPRLKPEETIVVPAQKGIKKIKVIGAVNKPGFFDMEEGVTVFELIYLAGGPAERADLSHVRRVFDRDGKSMEEIINVQSYIDKGAMIDVPKVTEGDIIIVYSRWYDWKTVLSILQNVLLLVVTIQAFSGAFK